MTRQELLPYRQAIIVGAKTLPADIAEKVPLFYDPWDGDGHQYAVGDRCTYGEPLTVYEVRQAHTSQADWTPDVAVSLYKKVADEEQGDDPSNPIPYDGNMELFNGKYYSQDGIVYICTRDSGQPLYHPLAQLVGLYVEVWTA